MNQAFAQVPFLGELLTISVQTSAGRLTRKHVEKAVEWLTEIAKDIDDPKSESPCDPLNPHLPAYGTHQ